ncbi:nuclear mitotic apparatus protein 1 [Aplysia californica]|uniref:Nuclear mitotic apparatus protein 1 n=1 Tax=Aplysia californica TaxID=6500 RepID=A0ABM1W2S1_APLCA|nr:nuclear mitotic apparatus protein 1 [Aplysia californica]
MEAQKKLTVLKYVHKIGGEAIESLSELKSGHFYLHVLGMLEQWNPGKQELKSDKERLLCVKKFLQDFYENDPQLEEFLQFDLVLGDSKSGDKQELELAKIAVVLLGIGVLDKNGQTFINAALQLPQELHGDIMEIIQSVVQAGSTEVALTTKVEEVLCGPTEFRNSEQDERCLSPVQNIVKSNAFMDPAVTSTPRDPRSVRNVAVVKDSPLKANSSLLNFSLRDLTSPLRGMSLNSSVASSPLAKFVQSPELIQKAVLKQKELELRKVKQQLNDQVLLKEEVQMTLQDQVEAGVKKDEDILKLQERVKELLHLKDSYDQLQEMKIKYSEMEALVEKMTKKVESLQQYKEQCGLLEKESSQHCEEMNKLHQEIRTLEEVEEKHKELVKTIGHLDTEVTTLRVQLDHANKSRLEWEEERRALNSNLEMEKEKNGEIKRELEELLAAQHANAAPGESMGIFVDLQVGELRCQLEELQQERDRLRLRLEEMEKSLGDKSTELSTLQASGVSAASEIERLTEAVRTKDAELESLNSLVAERNTRVKEVEALKASALKEVEEMKTAFDEKDGQLRQVEEMKVQLEENVVRLEEDVKERENANVEMKCKLEALTSQVKNFEEELASKATEAETLVKEKEQVVNELREKTEEGENLQRELVEKEKTLSDLLQEKESISAKLTAETEENEKLSSGLSETEKSLTVAQEELKNMCASVKCLTEEVEEHSETIKKLHLREADVVAMKEQLEKDNQDLQENAKHQSSELEQKENHLKEVKEQLVEASENVLSLRRQIDTKDGSISEMSEQCAQLNAELSHKSELLSRVENEKAQMTDKLSEEQGKTRELQAEIETLKVDVSHHVAACEEKSKSVGELLALKQSYEERVEALTNKFSDQSDECSIRQQTISDLSQQVADLQEQVSAKCEETGGLRRDLTTLTSEVESKSQLIGELENQLSEKVQAYDTLSTEKESVRTTLSAVVEEKESFSRQLQEKMVEISGLEQQLQEKLSEATSTAQEVESTKTSMATLQEAEVNLNVEIQELKDQNRKLVEQCEEFNCQVAQNVSEKEQLLKSVESKNLEIEAAQEQIEKLKSEVKEQIGTQAELQSDNSKVAENLAQVCGERDELKQSVEDKEAEIVWQLAEISRLTEETQQLTTTHQATAGRNEELSGEMALVVEERDKLTGDVRAQCETISTLNQRMAELEGKNCELENNIKELNEKLLQATQEKDSVSAEKETMATEAGEQSSQISLLSQELKQKSEALENSETTIGELKQQLQEQGEARQGVMQEKTEVCALLKSKEETVSQLTADLEQKNIALEESARKIEDWTARFADFEQKYNADISEKTSEAELLRIKVETLSSNMNDNEKTSREEVLSLKEQVHKHEASLLQKNEEVQSRETVIAELKETVTGQDSRMTELKTELDQRCKTALDLHSEVESQARQLEELRTTVEEQTSSVAGLTEVLNSKELALAEARDNAELERTSAKKLSEELEGKCSEISELTNTLEERSTRAAQLESRANDLEKELGMKSVQYEEMVQAVSTKDDDCKQKDEEHSRVVCEVQTLQAAVQEKDEQIEQKSQEIAHLNEEFSSLRSLQQDQISTLQKEHAGELASLKEETGTMLENLRVKFEAAKESEMQMLSGQKAEADAQLGEVRGRLQSQLEEVRVQADAQLEEVREQHQRELKEVRGQAEAQLEELRAQHQRELEEVRCQLEEVKGQHQRELEEVRCQLEEFRGQHQRELEELRAQHQRELEAMGRQHTEMIQELETQAQDRDSQEVAAREQMILSVREQYEQQLKSLEEESRQKLSILESDLKREQRAHREMEEELGCQRTAVVQLEEEVRWEKKEREILVHTVRQENEGKLLEIQQSQQLRVEGLVAENSALNKQISEFQDSLSSMKRDHLSQELVKKDLENQLSALREEWKLSREEQRANVEQVAETHKRELLASRQEVEEMMMTMAATQEQLEEIKEKYSETSQLAEDMQMKMDNLTAAHEVETSRLKGQLQDQELTGREQKTSYEVLTNKQSQLEKKCKTLQEDNQAFRERETKQLREHDAQMKKANEFCTDLRKQLDSENKKRESSEKELQRLSSLCRRHEQQVSKIKETNTSLSSALKIERDSNVKMQKRMEGFLSKFEEMKLKHEGLNKENKDQAMEMARMKVALDLSVRKVKVLQQQLDQAGAELLGDRSHFERLISEKEPEALNASIESKASSYSLRSRSRRTSGDDSFHENQTEDAFIASNVKDTRNPSAPDAPDRLITSKVRQPVDRMSIASTSSTHSIRSLNGVQGAVLPNAMSCANEPEGPDFEWNRLSELQRRNTMYLPHLQSSYPVEMQTVRKEKLSDDSLRLSLMPDRKTRSHYASTQNVGPIKDTESTAQKRKAPTAKSDAEEQHLGESPSKQRKSQDKTPPGTIVFIPLARNGPSYHRPGPPTPGKQPRRVSGRFTPSQTVSPKPVSSRQKGAGQTAPQGMSTPKKKRTPRRSPRFVEPLSPASSAAAEDDRRESVAFSIGFTPDKAKSHKRLMKRGGFFSRGDKNSAASNKAAHEAKKSQDLR